MKILSLCTVFESMGEGTINGSQGMLNIVGTFERCMNFSDAH